LVVTLQRAAGRCRNCKQGAAVISFVAMEQVESGKAETRSGTAA